MMIHVFLCCGYEESKFSLEQSLFVFEGFFLLLLHVSAIILWTLVDLDVSIMHVQKVSGTHQKVQEKTPSANTSYPNSEGNSMHC